MIDINEAIIRKDIFTAVIANGSLNQKENWKRVCESAANWIFQVETPKIEIEKPIDTSSNATTVSIDLDRPHKRKYRKKDTA